MKKTIVASAALCALALPAFAQLTITDPWIRATVPQQKATGAFMTITSTAGARLVEVRSPVAGVAEIHEMRMENGVMKMRAIAGLDLAPGKPVSLVSGGYHVMLMDLKQPMKEGDSVPITLVIEDKDKKRETIEVKALVRALTHAGKKGSGH